MTGLSRFDFYPRDWLSGTRGLSGDAKGLYIDLLAAMYDTGGTLPHDEQYLRKLGGYCQARVLRRVLQELVDCGKIKIVDGYLVNDRTQRELATAESRIATARAGGEAKAAKAAETPNDKSSTKKPDKKDLLSPNQGTSFVEKQPLNPCLPSPSPSKKKEPSKKKGVKNAFWALASEITTKSGRPEKQVRPVMGRLLNLHDGNFAEAAVVLETCLGKNDPFTYMTEIIKRLKADPPKQRGAGFNGPYERTQEDADYIASLDPCHLDAGEEAYLEELRREQADG